MKSPKIVACPGKSAKKSSKKKQEKENYIPFVDPGITNRSRRSKGERKKSSGGISQRKVENPEVTLSQIHQILLNPKNVEKEQF